MLLIILVSVAFLLYVIANGVSLLLDSKRTNIPGPIPWPLIGNGNKLLGDTTHFMVALKKLKDEYINAVRIYILSQRFIVLFDAKFMEPILSSSEHITKGGSYRYLHAWLGQGLLTASGAKWRLHRKFLTPAFHFNILQTFMPIFLRNNKEWMKKLKNLADGKPFDMFPVAASVALENVAEAAMGVNINSLEASKSEYVDSISVVSEIISTRMFNVVLAADAVFNLHPLGWKQRKALKILHGQTERVIAARWKQLKDSNVTLTNYQSEFGTKSKCQFLDLLLLSEVDGKRLDIQSVREEVDTFMFEGHDTTASAISFTLYCISNNSDVQEKVLAEQRELFGDDNDLEPTHSDLSKMKYLELVIKESLRLFPSVPIIARYMTQDLDIGEYCIPKDSNVTLDIFQMQRDAKYYDDPLAFKPERYLNDHSKAFYSWIPFSAGPRNCIGQKFAMMELKVTVSKVVRMFRVLPSHIEPILGADLILRSKNGVQIKLLPRND